MWNGKKISVVMATYKEKDSIRRVIEEFQDTGLVDEIIVVNNNAELGTDEEVAKNKASLLYENKQGYGHAFATGLRAAHGDYILTVEPDGTYTAKDLQRFLVFAEDFPVVLGSRAMTRIKNMEWGFFRRHANIIMGMMISFLFRMNTTTDIGCIYRLFHKEVVIRLERLWNEKHFFATDLMLLVVKQRIPYVEIAVTFQPRIGHSTMLGSRFKLFKYGMLDAIYILKNWFFWAIGRAYQKLFRTIIQ